MTIETYNIGDKAFDTESNCIVFIREININISDTKIENLYLVSQTPDSGTMTRGKSIITLQEYKEMLETKLASLEV